MALELPTICRVVVFTDDTGRKMPAIVTALDGTDASGRSVWLTAFPPGEAPLVPSHPIDFGPSLRQWQWPTRPTSTGGAR